MLSLFRALALAAPIGLGVLACGEDESREGARSDGDAGVGGVMGGGAGSGGVVATAGGASSGAGGLGGNGAGGLGGPSPPYSADPVTVARNLPPVVPVLRITIGGQTVERDVDIPGSLEIFEQHDGTLEDLDALTPTLAAPIAFQGRGNFTWSLPKKGYALELQDGTGRATALPVLGMPAGSDFALYACYTDKTCLRNALVYALGQELGRWSPRARFVELFIDGDYRGLYMLWERIRVDPGRMELPKPAASAALGDVSGGYVVRLEGGGKGTTTVDGLTYPRDFSTASGRIYTYHYPREHTITTEQGAALRTTVQGFEDVMESDPAGYASRIDVGSWVDHAIVEELTNNWDGYVHSVYMTKEPDSEGGRFGMGPVWDFDLAFGNGNVTGYSCRTDTWAYQNVRSPPDDVPGYWLALFADPTFRHVLACRWAELGAGPAARATFDALIDRWVPFIRAAHLRDQERWPTVGRYIFPNCDSHPTYEGEVAALREWIAERVEWMSVQLPEPAVCP